MTRIHCFHLTLANNFRLTIGIQDQTITGSLGATCFDSVDAHFSQEFVCVAKHVIQSTPASIKRDLPILLRSIKAETRLVPRLATKARQVYGRRLRTRIALVTEAMRNSKT